MCVLGGDMNLGELTDKIETILKEDNMETKETKPLPPTKKEKQKWSIDKYGNIETGGVFFNVADLKAVNYRAEADGTHTLTVVIGEFVTGFVFGKEKKSALGAYNLLKKFKKTHQDSNLKHFKQHHDWQEDVLSSQKKLVNEAKKSCGK